MKNKVELFKSMVAEANNIVISTHIYPDADGIGSEVALCLALTQMGKSAICVNEEPLLERYSYLDPKKSIISAKEFKKKKSKKPVDLFIVVDASSPNRIGPKTQPILESAKQFLFIDHHPCSPAIEAIHCVDTSKAATGQYVGELIHALGIEFTKDMALALYTSILIDTSSFRYPTVTGDTHRIIAKLLDTGIRPPVAYNKIYGTKNVAHMKLLGEVLSNIQISSKNEIAWLVVTNEMMEYYESDTEDAHAFINHLLILEEIKIACMFISQGNHIKLSMRSDGRIDVSEVAQALGGGGHNHSAAALFEGHVEEVVEKAIYRIELILESMADNPKIK